MSTVFVSDYYIGPAVEFAFREFAVIFSTSNTRSQVAHQKSEREERAFWGTASVDALE